MILLTIGSVLIVIALLAMTYPKLCRSLELNDPEQWRVLGCPRGFSFADMGGTSSVHAWVIQHGYQNSSSEEVVRLGMQALKRALFARNAMILAIFLMVLGFILVLFGI